MITTVAANPIQMNLKPVYSHCSINQFNALGPWFNSFVPVSKIWGSFHLSFDPVLIDSNPN
jgi:hypothetical protein